MESPRRTTWPMAGLSGSAADQFQRRRREARARALVVTEVKIRLDQLQLDQLRAAVEPAHQVDARVEQRPLHRREDPRRRLALVRVRAISGDDPVKFRLHPEIAG